MQPLYLIEADFGRIGRAFIETDRDTNSRAHVIELIRSGEVKPIKVLEIVEDEGTCRDVTDEFIHCSKWGDHETETIADRQARAFDHARDLRKHEVA